MGTTMNVTVSMPGRMRPSSAKPISGRTFVATYPCPLDFRRGNLVVVSRSTNLDIAPNPLALARRLGEACRHDVVDGVTPPIAVEVDHNQASCLVDVLRLPDVGGAD